MTRWLVLSALLLSLPGLTDWLVDRQFRHEPVEYTRQQRDAMSRLVERSVAAPVILSRGTGVASAAPPDCGENWLCLLAWSEEQHPTKHRKGHRNG